MKLNIENLKRADAYGPIIPWYLRNYRHGVKWFWEHALPEWVLWLVRGKSEGGPKERLVECAQKNPGHP